MTDAAEIGEKELARLCAQGDRFAIRELYTRYAARLCALCSRYSSGPEEGMDLMHDSLLKALKKMGHYRYNGPGSLYSWLAKISVNEAIDHLRREGRLQFTALDEWSEVIEEPALDEIELMPENVLQEMVSSLPNSKRLIFNLFCVEGLSHKQIADKLGIAEKTSSSTLARAKKMLSEMIIKYWQNNR